MPASKSGRWSTRRSTVTARASGDARLGSREHHCQRQDFGSKSGPARPRGTSHGHHVRVVPARAPDTGCHGNRSPTYRPCARNVENFDISTFHVLLRVPVFATSPLDEDDDSCRKPDIHRVVRVKLHTTRTTVFIARPILTENERSASECSTGVRYFMKYPGLGN